MGEYLRADATYVYSSSARTSWFEKRLRFLVPEGVASTHRHWKTPRQPRPCAGPRTGMKFSKNLRGIPTSERMRRMHSKTTCNQRRARSAGPTGS